MTVPGDSSPPETSVDEKPDDESAFLDSFFAFSRAASGIRRGLLQAKLDATLAHTHVPFDAYGLYRACCERGGFVSLEHARENLNMLEIFREMRNYRPHVPAPRDVADILLTVYDKHFLPYERHHPEDVCEEPCAVCGDYEGSMIQCDGCRAWIHEQCHRRDALVALPEGTFHPGDVYVINGGGVTHPASAVNPDGSVGIPGDENHVPARRCVRLEAGQEAVFVCDGCHYRDAWAPGSGDAFVDGDDAARQLRGFRFFLAENAPDEAAIAALELAPESLPAKLMDAETYCRLLCLRRGFTPLVSGVKCPVMPGGAERVRTIVEVEAEERGRGRNLQLDRGLRNAHVRGKVASDSTEEGRKRPRVRPNGDAAFADDDRAMSKIRKRRNGFRALLPSGLDEEEELLRRAMEASLEETTNAKDARDRETDANTDADPVDPDPVDLGNPRKPRDAKGAGGARSKSTRHPSPTNARVVRPKRDTAASGSKASPSPSLSPSGRDVARLNGRRDAEKEKDGAGSAAKADGEVSAAKADGEVSAAKADGEDAIEGTDGAHPRASRRGRRHRRERRKKSARKFTRHPSASDTGYRGYRIPKIPPPPTRRERRGPERFRSEGTPWGNLPTDHVRDFPPTDHARDSRRGYPSRANDARSQPVSRPVSRSRPPPPPPPLAPPPRRRRDDPPPFAFVSARRSAAPFVSARRPAGPGQAPGLGSLTPRRDRDRDWDRDRDRDRDWDRDWNRRDVGFDPRRAPPPRRGPGDGDRDGGTGWDRAGDWNGDWGGERERERERERGWVRDRDAREGEAGVRDRSRGAFDRDARPPRPPRPPPRSPSETTWETDAFGVRFPAPVDARRGPVDEGRGRVERGRGRPTIDPKGAWKAFASRKSPSSSSRGATDRGAERGAEPSKRRRRFA